MGFKLENRMRTGLKWMDHQGKTPTLLINANCQQYVEPLKQELANAGYGSFQSFDLQNTRALQAEGSVCPRHHNSQCTYEMVVLLVYPSSGDPVSVTLDGQDGKTFVYLLHDT